MLPEDFRTNIFIPGVVWLVCSVLITVGVMALIGDSDYSTFLFCVICIAIFAVPMAVYLECRHMIEAYFDSKKQKRIVAKGEIVNEDDKSDDDNSISPTDKESDLTPEQCKSLGLPDDFPKALANPVIILLLRAFAEAQILGKDLKPLGNYNATQLTFIAESITFIVPISCKWKVFGTFWGIPNMKNLLSSVKRRETEIKDMDFIYETFKKAGESSRQLADMVTYQRWIRMNNPHSATT